MSPTGSNICVHPVRGRIPAMKGCLKSPTPSPGPDSAQIRKSVAFGEEGSEEVYLADEWDRTPMEPARKLSYQDLLELKEIQRSLPRANQLADPVSGKPASHFLTAVPIGLLPLLSDSDSGDSQDSQNSSAVTSPLASPPSTPTGLSNPFWISPAPRPKERAAPQPWHPPHLAHLLPSKPLPPRQKPRFAFLPLLETPPSSEPTSPFTSNPSSRSPSPEPPSDTDQSLDPPTPSLTNASLNSSPTSRTSSPSPEPPFFQLPPSRRNFGEGYNKPHETVPEYEFSSSRDHAYNPHLADTPPSFGASLLRLGDAGLNPDLEAAHRRRYTPADTASKSQSSNTLGLTMSPHPARRRNVIEINGVEIDLDDDDDNDIPPTSHSGAPSSQAFCFSSISDVLPDSAPATAPGSPSTPPARRTSKDEIPSLNLSPPFRPSTPTRSASPSNRCTKSLCSSIRFQRDKSPKPTAI